MSPADTNHPRKCHILAAIHQWGLSMLTHVMTGTSSMANSSSAVPLTSKLEMRYHGIIRKDKHIRLRSSTPIANTPMARTTLVSSSCDRVSRFIRDPPQSRGLNIFAPNGPIFQKYSVLGGPHNDSIRTNNHTEEKSPACFANVKLNSCKAHGDKKGKEEAHLLPQKQRNMPN